MQHTLRHAPNIPQRRPKPGFPHRSICPAEYRQRNEVERLFGWLKEKRRFNTRYDKLVSSFKTMVTLACIE